MIRMMGLYPMTKCQNMIHYGEIERKLEKCQQRLLSLDLSLQTAIKGRMISTREGRKKNSGMQNVLNRITKLQLFINDQIRQDETALDLGMPDLNNTSAAELAVCNHFLTEQLLFNKGVLTNLNQLLSWAIDATSLKCGPIKMILRLSKLRKMIKEIEIAISKQDVDDRMLGQKSAELAGKMKTFDRSGHFLSNMKALIKLHNEAEAISERIVRLRRSTTNTAAKIQQMQNWLMQAKSENLQYPPFSSPSQEQFEQASLGSQREDHNLMAKIESRVAMIKSFVESQLESQSIQKDALPKELCSSTRHIKGATISKEP